MLRTYQSAEGPQAMGNRMERVSQDQLTLTNQDSHDWDLISETSPRFGATKAVLTSSAPNSIASWVEGAVLILVL